MTSSHENSSFLVTVMKSDPKKTAATPSTRKIAEASGDEGFPALASRAEENVTPPAPGGKTASPGMNMREAGLGVDWVWTNMERRC